MILHFDKVNLLDISTALTHLQIMSHHSFQARHPLQRQKAPQTIPNHTPNSATFNNILP